MAFAERIAYLVTVDPKNAVDGFGKVGTAAKKSVAEVDAEVKRLEKDIDALNRKQIKLGKSGDTLGANIAGIQKGAKAQELAALEAPATGLSGALSKLGLSGGAAGEGLSGMAGSAAAAGIATAGLAVGVAAAGKFAEEGVKQFQDVTAQVRAFARQSGASAEDSSKLVFAFRQLGVDSDTASGAMFKLGKNVDGSAEKLAKVGVQVAHDKNGNTDLIQTLLRVSDAYNATSDPAQKAGIAFAAFGKQGAALTPILARGREGLRDLYAEAGRTGQLFNDDDLDEGKRFSLAVKELTEAFKGLEIEAGKGLVPALTTVAGLMTDVAEGANKFHLIEGAGKAAFAALLPVIGPAVLALGEFGGASKKAADAADEAAASAANLGAQLVQATQDAVTADKDALTAVEAVARAQGELASAQDDVAKAADAEARKAQAVADAHDAEAKAAAAATDAEEALANARREAPRDIERAKRAVDDADRKVKEAQAAANRTHKRRPGGDFDNKAQDDLASALDAQVEAHEKLADLEKNKANPKAVQQAQAAKEAADKAARDAGEKTKTANALDPLKEQKDAADKLATAQGDVARAIADAKTALDGVDAGLSTGLDLATATKVQVDQLVGRLKDAVDLQKTLATKVAAENDPSTLEAGGSAGTFRDLVPRPTAALPSLGGTGAPGVIPQTVHTGATYNIQQQTVVAADPKEYARQMAADARLRRMSGLE